ncbi:hypothetical protein P5673_015042, partial [Acropora cervicornis]
MEMSLVPINGVPANTSTSRFSTTKPSNENSRFARVNDRRVSPTPVCLVCRLRLASATSSPLSVKLLRGSAFVFLPHMKPSARNGAKLLSSDKVYGSLKEDLDVNSTVLCHHASSLMGKSNTQDGDSGKKAHR